MQERKIVFLDIDGVVSPLGGAFSHSLFEPSRMLRIKRILDSTGAIIVLSSSWRTSQFGRDEVNKQLRLHGMEPFADVTPELPSASRAVEILTWIDKAATRIKVLNFVAIDDIHLAAGAPNRDFFAKHAIHTKSSEGITDEQVQQAIQMLQDSNNLP